MKTVSEAAQKLRETTSFVDRDGRVVHKPKPPGMRLIIKGPWTYEDLSAEEAEEYRKSKAARKK